MDIKKKITNAPQTPGVYYFKDRHKRVIYVGKAANLRARLRSYAQPGWKEDMLREASSITWEELSSDIEALIRESELIKKLKPHHNILMRDDKNYFFVAFTGDEFPRIYLTHQPNKDVGRPLGRPTSKADEVAYLLEPSAEAIIDELVPYLIRMQMYHLILEANASEHSARRVAMKTACDNADELAENLTLFYNKARQAAITKEIIEISGTQNALEAA